MNVKHPSYIGGAFLKTKEVIVVVKKKVVLKVIKS